MILSDSLWPARFWCPLSSVPARHVAGERGQGQAVKKGKVLDREIASRHVRGEDTSAVAVLLLYIVSYHVRLLVGLFSWRIGLRIHRFVSDGWAVEME